MNFKLQRDQVIEILHQPQRSHVTIKIILFFWHNYIALLQKQYLQIDFVIVYFIPCSSSILSIELVMKMKGNDNIIMLSRSKEKHNSNLHRHNFR